MRRGLLLLGAGGVAAGMGWAARDYRAWRALGPGGLPTNWAGWWRMTRWRLVKGDPLALPAGGIGTGVMLLADLPPRRGSRPRVAPHPVPHRQLDGHAPAPLIERLRRVFRDRAAADPARLGMALSHFEKRHEAVTLAPNCCYHADSRVARGEVGHVHPSDGSMHVILSPRDTASVIARGWGERHPLAGRRLDLPATYTLIYAPRDEGELAPVSLILDAAITHMVCDPADGAMK